MGVWMALMILWATVFTAGMAYFVLFDSGLPKNIWRRKLPKEESYEYLKEIMGKSGRYYNNRHNNIVDRLSELGDKVRSSSYRENRTVSNTSIEINIFNIIFRRTNNSGGSIFHEDRNERKERKDIQTRNTSTEASRLRVEYEELKSKKFFTFNEVNRLMNWLETEEGFNRSRMVLAKYTDTFLSIRTTLDESEELLATVPQQLQEEVLEVMDEFFEELKDLKKVEEELRKIEEQAIQDSLVNRMNEEKKFVRRFM